MSDPVEDKSLDIFGAKPVSKAVEHASVTAIDGLANFFGKLIMPSVEQLGLYGGEYFAQVRKTGMKAVMEKAKRKIEENHGDQNVHAPPRVVLKAIESTEWVTEDHLQDMWAGLIASSCSEEGRDESNYTFVDLLSRLSINQVLLLNHLCENAQYRVGLDDVVSAVSRDYSVEELIAASRYTDKMQFFVEASLLEVQGLIQRWYETGSTTVTIGPTQAALLMYVRCQGSRQSVREYFRVEARHSASDDVIGPDKTLRFTE